MVLFENGEMLNLRMDECWCFDADLKMGLSSRAREWGDVPDVELQIPDSHEIQRACQAIRSRWSSREELLRKFRAKMACESGVCRNH